MPHIRLLDTLTGQFVDLNPRTHIYAILSHTWDPEGEQTYQALQDIQTSYDPGGRRLSSTLSLTSSPTISAKAAKPRSSSHKKPLSRQLPSIWYDPRLSPKIRHACETARREGFRYIWIDSCCIDKTDSSELSKAINSMYAWYRDAKVCYAYLADVSPGPSLQEQFAESRWFARGWTLQELIAPREVVFLTKEWTSFGTKRSLAPTIERISGIGQDVLKHEVSLDEVSVAKRMSWASKRHTARLEDEAYCLLGIFNVYMPPSYGEGRNAFRRLQVEILRRIPDQSLFAWGNAAGIGPIQANLLPHASFRMPNVLPIVQADEDRPPLLSAFQPAHPRISSLFATSPHDFHSSGHVNSLGDHDVFVSLLSGISIPVQDYTPSPYGMRTQFPLLDLCNTSIDRPEDYSWYIAILPCTDERSTAPADAACSSSQLPGNSWTTPGYSDTYTHGPVFLPHLDREAPALDALELTPPRDPADEKLPKVLYTKWARDTLRARGYCVTVHPRTERNHNIQITLTKGPRAIHMACQYAATTGPRGLRFVVDIYSLYKPTSDVEQPRGFVSAGLPGAFALSNGTVTLLAGYDQRSYSETVSLPWTGGGEAVLQLALEPVSAVCHHLRIALNEAPPSPLEEVSGTRAIEDPEGDDSENRVVLRAGGSGVR